MTVHKVREMFDPMNRHPKEEPYKRYQYRRNGRGNGSGPTVPYQIEMPRPSRAARVAMAKEAAMHAALTVALKTIRFGKRNQGDPEIDDPILRQIATGWLGFGF